MKKLTDKQIDFIQMGLWEIMEKQKKKAEAKKHIADKNFAYELYHEMQELDSWISYGFDFYVDAQDIKSELREEIYE